MRITIVDGEGQREDFGPFDVEVTEAERAALNAVAGNYAATLDTLRALDDDRPDTAFRQIADAFEDFGDVAELEVEG